MWSLAFLQAEWMLMLTDCTSALISHCQLVHGSWQGLMQWLGGPIGPVVILSRIHTCHIQYDTIRDPILTCAWKPTWVSLTYCMETTAKKCKNRKTKNSTVKDGMCSEVTVNSLGNPCSESWRRKGKAAVGRICRKGRFWVWNERVSWWWNTDNNKYYCWQIMTV